jgi:hypothetical protein
MALPEEPNEAPVLAGRTRAALEREKTLVLRSIKELEFDRAMGKVADKDFQEMGARLRARAARLIRQLDAGSNYREEISKEIDRRIGTDAPGVPTPVGEGKARPGAGTPMVAAAAGRTVSDPASQGRPSPALDAVDGSDSTAAADTAPPVKCPHCGTENDSDSQFCKRCGASLEPTE